MNNKSNTQDRVMLIGSIKPERNSIVSGGGWLHQQDKVIFENGVSICITARHHEHEFSILTLENYEQQDTDRSTTRANSITY